MDRQLKDKDQQMVAYQAAAEHDRRVLAALHSPSLKVFALGSDKSKATGRLLVDEEHPGRGRCSGVGSGGVGSASHLAGELLMLLTHVQFTHVPYKSQGLTMIDLLGGQIQLAFPSIPACIQFVKAGKLTALGIATLRRSSAMPDVPTIDEAGVKGYASDTWYALLAPAATPPAVLEQLRSAAEAALKNPALREKFVQQGAEPAGGGPAALDELMRADLARWRKVVTDAKLHID